MIILPPVLSVSIPSRNRNSPFLSGKILSIIFLLILSLSINSWEGSAETEGQKSEDRSQETEVSPATGGAGLNVAVTKRPALRYPAREQDRSEEHTSELQSLRHLVCRLLLAKK